MVMNRSTKTDKLDELHERLTAQVEALVSGDDWKAMLDIASRLHRYRTGTRRYSNRPSTRGFLFDPQHPSGGSG